MTKAGKEAGLAVSLFTGGGDQPYFFGLATALLSKVVRLDVVGSDELNRPEWHSMPKMNFLNLRGSQTPDAPVVQKIIRVLLYYIRLIRYAATATPKVFHILWNNKFEVIDRTVLMLYYKLLGKTLVLTVHNVNAGRRDFTDTLLNRATLRVQYRLADHIFVHTAQMKSELLEEYGVRWSAITIIPFGVNNAVPMTGLTREESRTRLGIKMADRVILFFGNIAPYKGLEYLIASFQQLVTQRGDYRLVIAGRPKASMRYWNELCEMIRGDAGGGRILLKNDYIPDDEIELYFKAADVLVLPYRRIYQSGVLLLSYRFGLPVIATDTGSLREDIIEGQTGFLCRPEDPADLGKAIEAYFASELYKDLDRRRREIQEYAEARYSWDTVGEITTSVYRELLQGRLILEGPESCYGKRSV